jgi:hypothetical protein
VKSCEIALETKSDTVTTKKGTALGWLEKCYVEQDWYCWDLKGQAGFDPLRTEPRFQALLKKVGLDK